jgi:hypothetical protein
MNERANAARVKNDRQGRIDALVVGLLNAQRSSPDVLGGLSAERAAALIADTASVWDA